MSPATPLGRLIAARIAAHGPITLAEYMGDCLLHPEHGYYVSREPFGRDGDFTTAPEISQMFGELLGLCLAQYWLDSGSPPGFTLAEIGPGRGTLMADVLRATARVPGFHQAARITLIEASARLRALQRQKLAGFDVTWAETPGDLPEAPLYLLANEFFDALPIRQFRYTSGLWAEVMVGLSPEGALRPGLAPAAEIAALAHRQDLREGDIVEICPAAGPVIAGIASRIAAHGGLALILDYGGWQSLGDTFQALRRHGYSDPFAHPGEDDLTAHVDFAALAAAALPLCRTGYTRQGALLQRLGIDARAAQLSGAERLAAPLEAARRLTDPAEMGNLFKALALWPASGPLPAGFLPGEALPAETARDSNA